MILELDYSGHYPRKFIEITEEEWQKVQRLTDGNYISDTMEGQELLAEFEMRQEVKLEIKSVVAYI